VRARVGSCCAAPLPRLPASLTQAQRRLPRPLTQGLDGVDAAHGAGLRPNLHNVHRVVVALQQGRARRGEGDVGFVVGWRAGSAGERERECAAAARQRPLKIAECRDGQSWYRQTNRLCV
jgi:hypothetical protein